MIGAQNVGCDDRVRVGGAVCVDVFDRPLERPDHPDRQDQVKVLGVPVLLGRRFHIGDEFPGRFAAAKFDTPFTQFLRGTGEERSGGIPVDEERFDVVQLVRIDSEDLEWYLEEGVEYVIVSDGHWRLLFEDPERYAREIATYQDIINHSTVMQEFRAETPALLRRGYPTIPIYHFPDVLILRLEPSRSNS